jgi:hypothetical protein
MKIPVLLPWLVSPWLALLVALRAFASAGGAAEDPRSLTPPEQAFDNPKQIALAVAAQAGDVAAIEKAVKDGAEVKAVGVRQMTALGYAFFAGKKTAFARLLELGADPNVVHVTGESLLGDCIFAADIDYLKLALAHGGDPNGRGRTAPVSLLFRALSRETTDGLDLLLKAGADINLRYRGADTIAISASSVEDFEKLLFLLERGADPLIQDDGECDLVNGLFNSHLRPDLPFDPTRQKIIKLLESKGIKFDWDVIARYSVSNFGEATGKDVPMWTRDKDATEPNPAWVKAYPEKAEKWYRAVLRRPAPKL